MDQQLMDGMSEALDIVTAVRAVKNTYELKGASKPDVVVALGGDARLDRFFDIVSHLARSGEVRRQDGDPLDKRWATQTVNGYKVN